MVCKAIPYHAHRPPLLLLLSSTKIPNASPPVCLLTIHEGITKKVTLGDETLTTKGFSFTQTALTWTPAQQTLARSRPTSTAAQWKSLTARIKHSTTCRSEWTNLLYPHLHADSGPNYMQSDWPGPKPPPWACLVFGRERDARTPLTGGSDSIGFSAQQKYHYDALMTATKDQYAFNAIPPVRTTIGRGTSLLRAERQ